MRLTTAATILSFSTLSTAAPTPTVSSNQAQFPATVYGVDPQQPFYLSAYTTNSESSFILQPYLLKSSSSSSKLGLQAIPEGNTSPPSASRAKFTLTGNHYGTQLSAYAAATACSSSSATSSCDRTLLRWSSDSPIANQPLTFHQGADEPSFGGLALFGQYNGGDFEAEQMTVLTGAADTDYTKAWSVCDAKGKPSVKVLVYRGTYASCVPVTVRAFQVRS